MKVTVEFLSLPTITKIVGGKSLTLNSLDDTVSINDLIKKLTNRYGEKVGSFLLDESGKLDMTLKCHLNREEWIPGDQLDRPLKDGDLVTIMMLVGGG